MLGFPPEPDKTTNHYRSYVSYLITLALNITGKQIYLGSVETTKHFTTMREKGKNLLLMVQNDRSRLDHQTYLL